MDIKNSTILITGGSSGIGLELTRQLLENGAKTVIITGRKIVPLQEVKRQYPQVHTIQSDVNDKDAIMKLCKEVIRDFPELNILINNAGIMRNLDLLNTEFSMEEITAEIDISLSGSIRMIHAFLPYLLTKSTAAVVNVSSGLAFIPFPASPVYSAAKAGLHAYTRVLRLQRKKTNVKVFELAPPITATPLADQFTDFVDSSQNMPVDEMVRAAVKGIINDDFEIKPGLSKVLKVMSRVAPGFMFNFFEKSLQKAKTKKLSS